jgi:hypothetical protein
VNEELERTDRGLFQVYIEYFLERADTYHEILE